ncbi:hypothetical protein QFC19_002996 [Naganishia cerealis]|uniref:Uncharacterized protein n=1 Tax=Naganishia cerealis TaxID=610337 RepID=A0ACC2W5G4_9TREE|nr:hypothetical protein QFC19_002996 [Naganishia cerealis]
MPSSRNPKHAALWPKGNGKDAAYRNTRPDAHRASPLKSLRAVEGRPAKKGKGPLSKTADLQQVHNDVRESLNELPRVDAEADLQPQVIRDSVAVASLQSQPNQTTSTSAIQSSDQLGDYIARIANLERRLSAVQTEMGDKEEERRKEEEGRRNAERTVADLQRKSYQGTREVTLCEMFSPTHCPLFAGQVKLSNHSNRPLVIPQPKRPRSATWSWAKLEDVLGLNLPTDRSNWKDVHYARKELFLWIQGSVCP